MARHRNRGVRRRIKRAALMGGVAATSAAMTMGLTAPSAGAVALSGIGEVPGTEALDLNLALDRKSVV